MIGDLAPEALEAPLIGSAPSTPPTKPRVEAFLDRVTANRASIFAVALVPYLIIGVLTFANTADDPLITLRYAWNILHHGQAVFNLGDRVEGYTSPLHLLVATAVLMLPAGLALLKLKLVSFLFGAATIWQAQRLAAYVGLPRRVQLAAVIAVAGSWNFTLSASNGLETSLVAFLATGAAASLATPIANRRWWPPTIWTGLLTLSRPDAILIVVAFSVVSILYRRSTELSARLLWLIGPAVTLAALLAFRIAYYGDLAPNTFYAKHVALAKALGSGLSYLVVSQPLVHLGPSLSSLRHLPPFITTVISLLPGAAVLGTQAWLTYFGVRRLLRRSPAFAYAFSIVVAQLAFTLESGGDWMKGGRFFAAAIPAATVLIFATLQSMTTSDPALSPRRRGLVLTAAMLVCVTPVSAKYFGPAWRLSRGVTNRAIIGAGGNSTWTRSWVKADDLASCLRPGQAIAFSEVGLLGYERPNLQVIDTRGLVNRSIATTTPDRYKRLAGVTDPQWFLPTSSVGRVLLTQRPKMILSIDSVNGHFPKSILRNRYHLQSTYRLSGDSTLAAYLLSDFTCASIR